MKVIISGGGTGGHIFPAIAIADEIKKRIPTADILFVGAEGKMEMQRVPKAGYRIIGLPVRGLQRRLTFKNLLVPFQLLKSLRQAQAILKSFQPHVVVGVGGFASGPVLWVAAKAGIPTIIQEQNSYAGLTNRWLGRRVKKICVAYDGMNKYFPENKLVVTGNPVRADLLEVKSKRAEALAYYQVPSGYQVVVVTGGSLGAGSLNAAIYQGYPALAGKAIFVLWQTGQYYWDRHPGLSSSVPEQIKVVPFIDRMDLAYAMADLVVCRAGALSISELCVAAQAAILVPSPNVAEDHQTKNAQMIANAGGCYIVPDNQTTTHLMATILELLQKPEALKKLSIDIGRLGKPQATRHIVDEIVRLSA